MLIVFSINHNIDQFLNKDGSERILIIGDSHLQKGINPLILNGAKNIAQTSEPYYLTYLKLKKYINKNPKIKTVLLGFSYNNMSSFNDFKLLDPHWSTEMFNRYHSIIQIEKIPFDIPINRIDCIKIFVKKTCLYPNFRNDWIGGYNNFKKTNLKWGERQAKHHFVYNKEPTNLSDISMKYLDSMVSFTSSKKIKLILISTPLHSSYLNKIPSLFIDEFSRKKSLLEEKGIITLDYSHENYKDSLFLDSNHLNKYGAAKLTTQVLKELKSLD